MWRRSAGIGCFGLGPALPVKLARTEPGERPAFADEMRLVAEPGIGGDAGPPGRANRSAAVTAWSSRVTRA